MQNKKAPNPVTAGRGFIKYEMLVFPLLHQHHLPRLYEIACLEAVDVDAGW